MRSARCATKSPSAERRSQLRRETLAFRAANPSAGHRFAEITVPTHFFVIYKNETQEGGFLEERAVHDQMMILNDDFAPSGVSFDLLGVEYIHNEDWFSNVYWEKPQNDEMFQATRVGGVGDLNIYTTGFERPEAEWIGYATFPWEYKDRPDIDGVVVNCQTLPGGLLKKFNLGKTITHEVGHWTGLYHPFESDNENGSCTGNGDEVADTPFELSASSGCPIGRDTCRDQPGEDPIHNFMDYSDDNCLDEFTPGQHERLVEQLIQHRGFS
ncbi:hypothetical protein BJ165DRAFT_1342708 [Panaeolus papilionaceus]|nr:hypothetical protein BJ165DRAFT_1342708 [Panaeolus papilionaceus]